jgi:MATE family multidrug resistance protein
MFFVDRLFLTWVTTEDYPALAAVMPASMVYWTLVCLAMGTAQYVNTFVAQYEGAGQRDRVAASVWQGVYLSLAAGALFLAVAPFSRWLFGLTDHLPRVQELEVAYFSICCYGCVPMTLSAALACYYSGRGETLVVMLVNFGMVAVNIGLDYALVFGVGPFPMMGMEGAALATVVAYTVACVAYLVLIGTSRSGRHVYAFWRQWRFDPDLFRRLLRYGLPNGIQQFMEVAGFAVFIVLVGTISPEAMGATTIAFNVNSLAFIPMLGFGTAVMTLVGLRIGEGRPHLAERTVWLSTAWCGTYMVAFALIYLLAPGAVLWVYELGGRGGVFAGMRGEVEMLLRFVALYTIFDGMAIIYGSAIRGAGDTRFSVVFTSSSAWLLMVLPTAIAAATGRLTLTVCWWACSAYIIVLGLGLLWRFQAGPWKSMRVIEPALSTDEVPVAPALPEAATAIFATPSAETPDSDAA